MKYRRRIVFFLVAAIVGGLLIWKKQRVQYLALSFMVRHQSVPNEMALRDVVEGTSDRAEALEELWDTGKLVHREFVASYLREKAFTPVMEKMWPRMRPQMLEGAKRGDMDTQEAALAVLQARNDPQALPIALAMLADVDPGVRRLAIISLQQLNDKRLVPVFARMLEDPDRFVRGMASGAISTLAEHDVGIQFIAQDSDNVAAMKSWQQWWQQNKGKFDATGLPAAAEACCQPLGLAPDFALQDLDGKTVRLSGLKGKPVLMVFWATWSPLCVREIPDLIEFNRRCGNDVQLISIDVDSQNDLGPRPERENSVTVVDRVRQVVADRQINYKVLLDTDARALGPYNGGDLPVAVLIDKDGNVRRRFLGGRSADVLAKMVEWVNQPGGS